MTVGLRCVEPQVNRFVSLVGYFKAFRAQFGGAPL